MSNVLKTVRLTPDTREIKSILSSNIKQQEKLIQSQNEQMFELTKKLSKSNHYPNWLLAIFGALLLFFFSLTSYYIYKIQTSAEINNKYYEKGQTEVMLHFDEFLQHNHQANEAYQKWITKNAKE